LQWDHPRPQIKQELLIEPKGLFLLARQATQRETRPIAPIPQTPTIIPPACKARATRSIKISQFSKSSPGFQEILACAGTFPALI
jgi:hypothetical protein